MRSLLFSVDAKLGDFLDSVINFVRIIAGLCYLTGGRWVNQLFKSVLNQAEIQ